MLRVTHAMPGLLALGLLLHTLAQAGEAVPGGAPNPAPPPGPPWRQFPELPQVLLYDGFEHDRDWLARGSYLTFVPPAPGAKPPENMPPVIPARGKRCYKLGEPRKDKTVSVLLKLKEKTKLRFFDGIEPEQCTIQIKIWTDHNGTLEVRGMASNGSAADTVNSIKPNQWSVQTLKFSDMHEKNMRFKADSSMDSVEILFHPKPTQDQPPNVYIDDLIISYLTPPEQLLQAAQVLEDKNKDLEHLPERDGYAFSAVALQLLQTELKTKRKHRGKNIVVAAAKGELSEQFDKTLEALAAKKRVGLKFVVFSDAEGGSAGGLADLRALLPYNLQKQDACAVLIVLTPADAQSKRGLADLQLLCERALALGCVPVPCLPSMPESTTKKGPEPFNKSARDFCLRLGLPWVEQGFAVKEPKTETLTQGEMEAVSGLSFSLLAILMDALY